MVDSSAKVRHPAWAAICRSTDQHFGVLWSAIDHIPSLGRHILFTKHRDRSRSAPARRNGVAEARVQEIDRQILKNPKDC